MMLIFLLSTLMIAQAQERERIAAGYDAKVDVISEKYDAGAFLIYDCQEKHWTCVVKSYFEQCGKERDEDMLEKRETLRCAPIGEFPTKKSCFQRQLFMTGQNFSTRFCNHDLMREREVRF